MQGPWTQWKTPRDAAEHFAGACGSWKRRDWHGFAPTGNQAFDEFLGKLRSAKDREDFERFMKDKDAPKTQE